MCRAHRRTPAWIPGLLLALFAPAAAAAGFAFEPVFSQLAFDKPLFLAAAPVAPQRLYVATQGGRIFHFPKHSEPRTAGVFLDLRDRVTQRGGEEGLLGLAFHPDFASNRWVYVYYTPADRPRRTVLSRLRAKSADAADPASEPVLLTAVPKLRGQYLYADFGSGTVWALDAGGTGAGKGRAIGSVPDPSSFGEDAAGEVYLTSFTGRIYQLVPRS